MNARAHQSGFSLIELMVTIAIGALLLVLAMPYFGKTTKQATERRIKQQLVQDITWARGAAGAADQKSLDASLASGTPIMTMKIWPDCHWDTKIGTVLNTAHSLAATPTTMACAPAASGGVPALPVTITFSPQGFVDQAGTLVITGTTQTYQLQLLYSGSVIETHAAAGVES